MKKKLLNREKDSTNEPSFFVLFYCKQNGSAIIKGRVESEKKDQITEFYFVKECKTRNAPHIEVEVINDINSI